MKKILLTLVGSALISSFALQAQQQNDTTGIASESRTGQQDDQQPGRQTDRYQDPYGSEGMVIIEKEEIPESLKERLKDKKYEGWENGTIYHNTNTGEYVIAPRAYRFNRQGEEIELRTTMGAENRDGRESRYSRDDAQSQAREQMGEIPTSATKDQPDTTSQPGQPSTGYRDKQNDAAANSQSQADHFRTDDMTEIQAEQIPATLRRTLSEKQYEGWDDKGTLYQDPTTSEYVLVMDKSDNASQPRAYRFDKNGQLKESQNGTTPMNDQ